MEIKVYKPAKNQFPSSLSIDTIAESYSGSRNTKNIEAEKNTPVKINQDLCF